MKLFKHLLAMAVLMLSVSAIYAQVSAPPPGAPVAGPRVKKPKLTIEERATRITDTLNSVVNLTQDQFQKVYAANLKFLQAKESIRNSGIDAQTAKVQAMGALKKRRAEIESILTPQQVSTWDAWKQARRGQFKQNHPNMGKGMHPGMQGNQTPQAPAMDDIDGM